ncbi:hypothetical protein, partial [Halorubrum yunnanense]
MTDDDSMVDTPKAPVAEGGARSLSFETPEASRDDETAVVTVENFVIFEREYEVCLDRRSI